MFVIFNGLEPKFSFPVNAPNGGQRSTLFNGPTLDIRRTIR